MRERVEALLQREGLSLSDDEESSRSTEVVAPGATLRATQGSECVASPTTPLSASSATPSLLGAHHGPLDRRVLETVDDSVVGLRASASIMDDAGIDGPPSFRLDWTAAADDGEGDSFKHVDSCLSAEQRGDKPGAGRRRLSVQRNISRGRRGSIDYASLL